MRKPISYLLMLKGAVAGSVTMLALFGVSIPYLSAALNIDPSNFTGGTVAVFGAVLGTLVAVKA